MTIGACGENTAKGTNKKKKKGQTAAKDAKKLTKDVKIGGYAGSKCRNIR